MHLMQIILLAFLSTAIAACESDRREPPSPDSNVATDSAATDAPAAAASIRFGDGTKNWIVIEGATRTGDTLTFPRVQIDGNGWLVLHPFENGKPVGERYVGASFLESGANEAVEVRLDAEPVTGDFFLVMLHRDVNENREFDFVFVDERNVLDRAVFEGTTMIAHPFRAP